jgi:hypothetical protein
MKSVLPLSLDIKKAEWLDEEAKRLNLSRSQIIRDLLDTGMLHLSKRVSVGYIEIDFLEASNEEILSLMRRCALVLKERKKAHDLSTSTKIEKESQVSSDVSNTQMTAKWQE